METDFSTSYVHNLSENVTAIREFSKCMDAKFRYISNWEEFAYFLEVTPDVITACKLYFEYSPTLKIFEYLKITSPGMIVDELKAVFTRNDMRARHDIKRMIDSYQELKGDSKVAEVITDSTSNLLDRIALKLDSATRPVCNWLDFGLELGIQRDILQQFEMYVNYNPTENLLRCVYTTSKESLKLSTLLEFLELMNRHYILEHEDIKAQSKQDISTIDAKDVFKLGSKLLYETSLLLNRDIPGAQGWRRLAELFLENSYIDDQNIISKLEPPKQHEIHSPTTKTIEWLAANKPTLTIGRLIGACENIDREDAIEILLKHFPTCSLVIPEEQDESVPSNLPLSIQETSERTEHILQGIICSFGLPESTPPIIGREKEIKSLVSELSGDNQLVVLHGPKGIGKETLSVAAAKELVKRDCICVHVTSDGILSVDDLAVKILTTCGFPDPVSEQQEKVKLLFKTLPKRCILILQNIDHMFHSSSEVPGPVEVSQSAPTEIPNSNKANDCDAPSTSLPTSRSLKERFSNFFHRSSTRSKSTTNAKQDVPPYRKRSFKRTTRGETPSCIDTDETNASSTLFSSNQESSFSLPWIESDEYRTEKEKYHTFLEELLLCAPDLKILITTWESFASTRVIAKQIEITPISREESKQLLLWKCRSVLEIDPSCIPEDLLNRVLDCCSGNPQLLQNAVVIFVDMGASAGAEFIASSPLTHKLAILCPPQLPKKSHVSDCLRKCFDHLDKNSQKGLVMMTVFPGSFTVKDAHEIFHEGMFELRGILNKLKIFSFLLHSQQDDSYCLTLAMKSFAVNVATSSSSSPSPNDDKSGLPSTQEAELNTAYKSALYRFVLYTFNNIEKIEEKFFSTHSKEAIQEYKQQVGNLKEIVNWCISGRLSSDTDLEEIKHTIIHSFVQCYLVNVKLMKNHLLKTIICKLAQTCQNSTSYSKKLFVDCLIYGGVTFVLSCLCVPQLCVSAQAKAKWCFNKAIKAVCESSQYSNPPDLNKQLEIICECDSMSDGARTQLLIKFGKCLVRQGWKDHGLAFIRKGIELRKKEAEKSSSNRDKVMVAVGYNDMASAYSYIGYHHSAIYQRQNRVLPVYHRLLGIHPFTASAQSHLAHDLLAVGRIEEALKSCEIALKYRQSLLEIHSETARSLFDMGRIIREQACGCEDPEEKKRKFEKALEYFKLSLEMRHLLANLPQETANTHQEIADVLIRLGRDEEASVQYAEIPKLLESNNRWAGVKGWVDLKQLPSL